MFRFSQLASQLISLAAIGIYLAAAFLPCEPTVEERSALATALTAESVHAMATQAAPPPAAVATHQHDHGKHDHGAHDHQMGSHTVHGEDPAQGEVSAPASHQMHAAGGSAVRLSLKAKCVCGCDRTRSQVGGGAARLGSVVLVAIESGLPPAPVVVPEDRVLTRWVEVHFEDDPVPI